jgi:hypothetical protein
MKELVIQRSREIRAILSQEMEVVMEALLTDREVRTESAPLLLDLSKRRTLLLEEPFQEMLLTGLKHLKNKTVEI